MSEIEVKWPKNYVDFRNQMKAARKLIMNGTVVAIDPSSKSPGFAIFHKGQLECSGVIAIPKTQTIYERLQTLHQKINTIVPDPPDAFLIEQLRGQHFSHQFLTWSVGASIAAARTAVCLEVPLNWWKSLAKVTPEYEKSDQSDAEMIGMSVIKWCKEIKE